MDTENEIYFGDKNTFAIRYASGVHKKGDTHLDTYCHLVLSGQIIGDKNEPCYIRTWQHYVQLLKDQIKNDFDSIKNSRTNNKSDSELFDLIWKSDQVEKEFEYGAENSSWENYQVSIDETIDAYFISINENQGEIKFLWKGWRSPCPKDKMNELFSITVNRSFVVETIEDCLRKIENDQHTSQ